MSSGNNAVITGVGVIAPNGIGKEKYWEALEKGKSGIKPATLFDTTYFKSKLVGECTDFDPVEFLGKRGHRNLDRATKMIASAAKLAIDDANLEITDENTDDIGVVTATTLSVAFDIAQFTKEVVQDGPNQANPALFPATTMNYPSSHIAIRYKLKGFNTTMSTGFSAGLDVLKYAVDFIKLGRAKVVLVSGVESASFSNFVGFYKAGFLAGRRGDEISCPFDNRHNGIILGEGSSVIIVEDEEHAKARQANIYARVQAVKTFFDAYRTSEYDPKGRGLKRSMFRTLAAANLGEAEIDYVCAAANSVPMQDKIETQAIKDVFNIYADNLPISAIKSMLGESSSAAGGLQVAAAVGAIVNGFIPATINYKEQDPECDLDCVANKSRKQDVNNVMINNFGPGGNNTTAIITKYRD